MCLACIEYTKDKLTVNELSSNIREMSVQDQDHFREVKYLIDKHAGDPKKLKEELEKLKK